MADWRPVSGAKGLGPQRVGGEARLAGVLPGNRRRAIPRRKLKIYGGIICFFRKRGDDGAVR